MVLASWFSSGTAFRSVHGSVGDIADAAHGQENEAVVRDRLGTKQRVQAGEIAVPELSTDKIG